jgi:hypothetical protein
MPVFKGTTGSSVSSGTYNVPCEIKTFVIVNKSGGAITLNASIVVGSTLVSLLPYNLVLDTGDTVYEDAPIKILSDFSIYLTTTGNVDYYFSISYDAKGN